MKRCFNVTGACDPQLHYMVNLQERLEKIKTLVDSGAYFTISRARQYGKTTTLMALADYLKKDYIVISLDFQKLGNLDFDDEHIFSKAFAEFFLATVKNRWNPVEGFQQNILNELSADIQENIRFPLRKLFIYLSELCGTADRPVILMIDEVDSAANSQVFLDFLAQLRGYYLTRKNTPAFQSVILASVYDIKNISQKIHPGNERKMNSPWNIAADFHVEMSFSKIGIERMLKEYEADRHTGMNTDELAELIVDYSSGYPFLVSRICKLTDEVVAGSIDFPDKASAWTKEGILKAVNLLLSEKNTLFESLINKSVPSKLPVKRAHHNHRLYKIYKSYHNMLHNFPL
ncbi:AAA-like domain-containing protein [Candidatus Merdisoma sp. JLR.KK006]|uniref:AAA-like domain-containing protein n=1 Tax=Candidatus Merdisoma sp. JLR.KK006 TaxID=3112626 RepID=UPI002FF032DD